MECSPETVGFLSIEKHNWRDVLTQITPWEERQAIISVVRDFHRPDQNLWYGDPLEIIQRSQTARMPRKSTFHPVAFYETMKAAVQFDGHKYATFPICKREQGCVREPLRSASSCQLTSLMLSQWRTQSCSTLAAAMASSRFPVYVQKLKDQTYTHSQTALRWWCFSSCSLWDELATSVRLLCSGLHILWHNHQLTKSRRNATWSTPTTKQFHQWLTNWSRRQVLLPGICCQLF